MFQFHFGPIQTVTSCIVKSMDIEVSIPLWSDSNNTDFPGRRMISLVSIPLWSDSNIFVLSLIFSITSVSIPLWSDSNKGACWITIETL